MEQGFKTQGLSRQTTIEELNQYIDAGRAILLPFQLNQEAWIMVNKRPFKVIVTDIAVKSIQLSGAWYTWEQLEQSGGIFNSEFEALTAVALG